MPPDARVPSIVPICKISKAALVIDISVKSSIVQYWDVQYWEGDLVAGMTMRP